jgi:hypothetical protein
MLKAPIPYGRPFLKPSVRNIPKVFSSNGVLIPSSNGMISPLYDLKAKL